jgi:hypothetical protein
MNLPRLMAITCAMAILLVACDSGETTLSTGSTLITTTPDDTNVTSTTAVVDETSTTIRGQTVTEYEVVARLSTANGEVLHIVIPMGGYTDVDLENFIIDLKEADPELWGAEVFDDPGAPAAFAVDEAERSAEQETLLDQHHLVSLVAGETIRFQGPFAELGDTVIGS